ncbi:MAG: HAMP domain-containing protein [Desulfobacteraceae bacterium]|nr:HAMP domain-containing protein [Desulfobacteraceae bacterium]MBC2757880.1 HAMP domain-containing protein [Desulfobacteraceae bacterium]
MAIRTKIGVILLCAVISFSVVEYCVQQFIILPGFFSLERDEAVKDADRVSKAIKNEIRHLSTLCWDWSAWDDTYDFVQSRSKEYIKSNLVLSTFTGNNLNLIYICDADGHVVWGKIYDAATESEVKLSLFPKDFFPSNHPLLIGNFGQGQTGEDIKGVLITEMGPITVSANPILKSNNEGPPLGTFIMGRFLNADMVLQIAEQTQVDFSLTTFSGSAARLEPKINKEIPFNVEVADDDHLNVYLIFPDINGNSAIGITTNFHRKISRKGYDTVQNSTYSTLIAGMGILILILLSLKLSILNPISILSNHVFSIKKTGDLSKRLLFSRNDEIGTLANEFDNMVSRIEQSAIENDAITKQLCKDIEKRKQMDDQIRHSQKMEAMTTLTAGIAHNFNNILSVIVGCTELAVARLPKDNQAVKLLKKVEEASARAKDIVWQLIRFSQKYENNFLPVQVVSVIEKEIKGVESVMSGKIRIISQLQEDCYPVFGDVNQFQILMKNLLTNSVESIKNGRGVIEVQLANIPDSDAANVRNVNFKNGKFIRLTIRDNGQGIDPSHLDRIFDPYFTTKDFSYGAGMGLSVVHGIVTNNGGSITVDSKVDRGTEISIFFPAAEITGEMTN